MKIYLLRDCKKITINGTERTLCPECHNHPQEEECGDYDCKRIIYENELDDNGKYIQHCQCQCYSLIHE